jgi:hypothetical protein
MAGDSSLPAVEVSEKLFTSKHGRRFSLFDVTL